MIWLNDLQKETLLFVDDMITQNKTFNEIYNALNDKGYSFRVEIKNGYASKTRFEIIKWNDEKNDFEYSFVDLIKRRNGLAHWETIRIH